LRLAAPAAAEAYRPGRRSAPLVCSPTRRPRRTLACARRGAAEAPRPRPGDDRRRGSAAPGRASPRPAEHPKLRHGPCLVTDALARLEGAVAERDRGSGRPRAEARSCHLATASEAAGTGSNTRPRLRRLSGPTSAVLSRAAAESRRIAGGARGRAGLWC
jgi:hypothetical protein